MIVKRKKIFMYVLRDENQRTQLNTPTESNENFF